MAPPPSSSSSQVPYIGSTISLLSKAGIRYEGFLHSIDQKEASVTLDHVRVFGTEDRQCERRVPPSSDTFEYIIFRAADITELRVIDTPLSRPVPDPAIIRVQVKARGTNAAAVNGGEAIGGRSAGAGGSGGRRRQVRGVSAGRAGGRSSRSQNQTQQQQQQPHQQQQQQHLLPPPPMMQLPVQSPQQSRSRNDWYSWYSVSYRGNNGGGGGAGNNGGGSGCYSHSQFRPPPSLYPAADFAAAASNGYAMRPHSGGGGVGGRPVMHFRRYHGSAQRRLSPRLINGGGGISGSGGSRGRNSRRSHQSNGIAEASANPAKYFSADYDFETANAEMAKMLLSAVKSSANGGGHAVNGGRGLDDSTGTEDMSASVAVVAAPAATVAAATADSHCGYDRERSFYDNISRVDIDAGAAAGGDSAKLGRKDAARQNALNRETFGLSGRRFHGNHQHHRGAPPQMMRRSPV